MRIIAAICLLLLPSVAAAENPANDSDYLAAYAGLFDVTQGDDQATMFGVEYRYKSIYRGLRPLMGVFGTTDEAVYGYGGLAWDLYLTDNIVFTPNLAVGAFHHGTGKNLGYGLEFRDGLELNYQFDGGERVGLHFNHMSHAGLGHDNPGTEVLMLMYHEPLNWNAPASSKRWWK